MKIGEKLITKINNRFLLPSPKANAGEIANERINNIKNKYEVFSD